MKKIVIFLILIMVVSIADVHAQRRRKVRVKPLSFDQGDFMLYVLSGYPMIPGSSFNFSGDKSDFPPIGGGFQLSVVKYLSLGSEFIFTYTSFETIINSNQMAIYENSYFFVTGKVLLHYPTSILDLYIGGAVGYRWERNDVAAIENLAGLHWSGNAGIRLAFGSGSPFGIFVEGAYPYPIIAGGIYFRFKAF